MSLLGMVKIQHQYLALISGPTALICSGVLINSSQYNAAVSCGMFIFLLAFSFMHFRSNRDYFCEIGIYEKPYLVGISIIGYSILAGLIPNNHVDAILFLAALALADCEDTASKHLSAHTVYFLFATFLLFECVVVKEQWFRYFLVVVCLIIFALPHSINVPEADRMGAFCLLGSIGSLELIDLSVHLLTYLSIGFVFAMAIVWLFYPKRMPFFSFVSPVLTIYLTVNLFLVGSR